MASGEPKIADGEGVEGRDPALIRRGAGRAGDLPAMLRELEAIERPSASPGEREAAMWLAGRLRAEGAEVEVEVERVHGTYWIPIGIGAGAGLVGGLVAALGRRVMAAVLGLAGLAAIATDFPPRSRPLRRLLSSRDTYNVIASLGDPDASRTVVLVAHHDAANSGLVFHPGIPELVSKTGLFRLLDTSPMLMAPVMAGPLLSALAGLTGRRGLGAFAAAVSAGSVGAMADVASRGPVPAANDNGTAVVGLVELARRFRSDPPADTRLILLSTGSEESLSEGMRAFGQRHFPDLPRDRTFFINMDTIGSPYHCVIRGEGFLKMFEYPAEALALADRTAREEGLALFPNLRIRNGTDGLEALAAGYPVVSICSCTEHKQPANYHWPNDLTENVDFVTVVEALDLAEAMVRRLDDDWDGALGRS
jgi:hypothetical protein